MRQEDIYKLVRENVKRLIPYSSARDEFKGNASTFLDANENPFPTNFNRYPDPHQLELKNAIGKIKNVRTENIFIGNGSDEAIDLLYRIFCAPGKHRALSPQPTYGMYQVSAGINDIAFDTALLTSNFELKSSDLLAAVKSDTRIIFLCSPNNPSGNLFDRREIENVLNTFDGITVIDEAYIDFCDEASWTMRLQEFPNLVVLQTLSKAWGLASLRLGMAFASESIISLLDKVKPPYNISGLTQKTVITHLSKGPGKMKDMVAKILRQKEILAESLQGLNVVSKVFPSDANFLLVQVANAKKAYHELVKNGIIVRNRSNVVLCDNALRITVGTATENQRLIKVLKKL